MELAQNRVLLSTSGDELLNVAAKFMVVSVLTH
jgi:hypothetical protein